jgi:predicted hydrocarbon binding protein
MQSNIKNKDVLKEDEKQTVQVPSWLWNIVLRCTTDNLGEKGTNTILRRSGLERYHGVIPPYDDTPSISTAEYCRYKEALVDIFGEEGARPILIRSGRLGYKFVQENLPPSIKVAQKVLGLLPEKTKLNRALIEFLKNYDKAMGTESLVTESDGKVIVEMLNSTSQGMKSKNPACYVERELISTMLQYMVGSGYEVEEICCMGMGDPVCRFEIRKVG